MPAEHLPQPSTRSNRLATRVRILYVGIPALTVLVLAVIFGLIVREIADDSAQRLARQYSIEASANFLNNVNSHFVLMQQISRSTTISRWLASEDDPALKALAFEEIMGYVVFLPDAYVMFSVYETRRAYHFSVDLSLEEFYSRGYVEYGYENQWFFDTRDAEAPFILNVQRNWPDEDGDWKLHLWSNHRMYYQGRFVGVFTVGSLFDGIFQATFGGFDMANERGYIIDQNGIVRVDSAMLLQVHDEGLPTFPAIPEAAYSIPLVDHLNRHLERIRGGTFQPGQETLETIPLPRGIHRYASITPIIGTPWSVVVLSNHFGGFGGARYRPLIFGTIAMLVFSVLVGNALVRREVLTPLFRLTESAAAAASVTAKTELFGLGRKDEIGDLARTVQYMRNSLNSANMELLEKQDLIAQTQETLRHREKLLQTVNQAAEILLSAAQDNFGFKSALLQCMEMIGHCLHADRVQLWRANMDAKGVNVHLGDQWLSELGRKNPQVDTVLKIPYGTLPKWEEQLLRKKCINGPVADLPPVERNFLDPHGKLKSVVIIPVFLEDRFWGLLTIDDCVNERTLSGEEMDILRSASLMIASTYNRVELAMKEEETHELNQALINAAPYVIGLWDDSGNLKVASPQAMDFFGIPDPRMVADDLYAYSPEFQPCGTPTPVKAAAYAAKAYKEGEARFEWLHKRTDGELLPAECFYKIYKYKGKNLLLSYTRDLREIKAAEAKQREANEMVNMLLDASPMFIEIWDESLNLIDCNNRVMDLFGLPSKAEFLEKYDDFSPKYQPCGMASKKKHEVLLKQALEESYAQSEWTHLTASGEELPVEVIFTHLIRQNKHFIVGYNHDLREIKRAIAEMHRIEIAEENNRAKSRFLARMSHEIRTPITAVLGISEIELQNPNLSLHLEESFAKIHNSANLLLAIINDILDLSKIEAGKMEILQKEYEVASMVSDVACMHLTHVSNKDIKFKLSVDENLPACLIGDALRIGQIMNNLLSNAFKYTESGSVEMSLQCQKHEENEDYLTLIMSIRDTGVGMTQKQLDALYKDYTRFHELENPSVGTGLGMPIVYSLVQLMDANINMKSEVGVGTSVVVRIPQKIASNEVLGKDLAFRLQQFQESARVTAKKFKFVPESMPYGRVLIVDDVEANLYVAKGLLAFYDLAVETCDNGYAAIEKAGQGNVYDIVFMDYMMPGINGIETMRAMREMGYTGPIVALTANALIGKAEEFLKSGFDGFISKPIQTDHLNTILTKYIRDKQPPEVIKAARDSKRVRREDIDSFQSNADLQKELRMDFARSKKNLFLDISQALNTGDTNTAHRLAHNLKGLAGLIQEQGLANAARVVEHLLKDGHMPGTGLLSALENELARVLHDIGKPEVRTLPGDKVLDKDKAMSIFKELTPLLESGNSKCQDFLEELHAIPETAVLARQIEEFEFESALATMATLMTIVEEQ